MGNSFKENVREELEFQGLSAKELSLKTKIPYQTLQNYLNARATMPPADYACRIAQVLNTSAEKLVLGKNPNQPPKESKFQKGIRLFSKLSDSDQTTFIRLMEALLKK